MIYTRNYVNFVFFRARLHKNILTPASVFAKFSFVNQKHTQFGLEHLVV